MKSTLAHSLWFCPWVLTKGNGGSRLAAFIAKAFLYSLQNVFLARNFFSYSFEGGMLSLWTKVQEGLVLAKNKKKHYSLQKSISCENFFSFSFEGRMLSLWTKGQGGPVLATMPLVLSFVTFSNRNSFFVLLTSGQGTSSHYQESYCD